jgi:hypothetical protein
MLLEPFPELYQVTLLSAKATSATVPLNDVHARTSSTDRPTAELPSNAQYVVINDSIAPPEVLDNLQEQNVRQFTKAYMSYQSRCPFPKAPWHFVHERLRPLFRRFVLNNLDPDLMTRQEQMDKLKVYSASIHVSFKNVLQDIQPVKYVSQAGLAALYTDVLLALNEHEVPLEQFETRVHFLALWDILLSKLPQPLADYLWEKRNQLQQPIDKWSLADPWSIEKTRSYIDGHLMKELNMSPPRHGFVQHRQSRFQTSRHVPTPRFPWTAIPRNLTLTQFESATCVNCFDNTGSHLSTSCPIISRH